MNASWLGDAVADRDLEVDTDNEVVVEAARLLEVVAETDVEAVVDTPLVSEVEVDRLDTDGLAVVEDVMDSVPAAGGVVDMDTVAVLERDSDCELLPEEDAVPDAEGVPDALAVPEDEALSVAVSETDTEFEADADGDGDSEAESLWDSEGDSEPVVEPEPELGSLKLSLGLKLLEADADKGILVEGRTDSDGLSLPVREALRVVEVVELVVADARSDSDWDALLE
jgi:hypothetical protein